VIGYEGRDLLLAGSGCWKKYSINTIEVVEEEFAVRDVDIAGLLLKYVHL